MAGAGRRLVLAGLALTAPAIRRAWAGQAHMLVVGAAEGSDADLRARSFAPFLERHLPHTRVNVVNLPADGGLAALRMVAGDAGGRVLGWIATPALAARALDTAGAAEVAARLALIAAVQREPVVVTTPPAGPKTLEALVAQVAADQPAVGLPQALGTPPPGSAAHLAALRLQAAVGKRLNIVAFPSAAAARKAAKGGDIAAAVLAFGAARQALARGHLVALPAVAGPGDATVILRGLAMAADAVPLDGRGAALAAALARIAGDPEFQDQANAEGFTGVYLDGAAWSRHAAAEQGALALLWRATPWRGAGIG
jgi:tripartite-type tricarboxylate transporter receptor subunit TctC